jgi:hypothetical protein
MLAWWRFLLGWLLTTPSTASVFCLEPHGDSPTRGGFYDALYMGCIPVIFDYSASGYAEGLLNGLLSRTLARLEDIAVIIDYNTFVAEPEILPLALMQIYTNATELARRREVLRRVVPWIMVRADDRDDDMLTLVFGMAELIRQQRNNGTLQFRERAGV